ncbi:hypothetical protein NLU13_2437 [Sarocladium strictum]|uniref:Major facilitator superfamily (MFS) profile domain-containing protein n=1 Tax=Sarocladium strictum TaxID=5046 RepID=A0AA39LD58_SARSR|nr:hypothetical protein NLU13_2437 [Sarocladium strictum]
MTDEKQVGGSEQLPEDLPTIVSSRRDADFDIEADGSSTVDVGRKEEDSDERNVAPLSLAQLASIATNDPNAVRWNGEGDPENPMNWTAKKKWLNIGVISVMTLLTPLGSSMFAPGVPDIMREFGSTDVNLATFILSVYVAGFAFGPLVAAPMSELYGRAICYNVGNALFVIFTIATALSKNMGMLIAFRFLMGFAGSTPITNGSGTISDMFPVEQRGKAMAIWALGPLLGPALGPVAGGFLVEATNWRWVFWVIAIVGGVITTLGYFLVKETYPPVLLKAKVRRLSKETGNQNLYSVLEDRTLTRKENFKVAIVRPLVLLCTALPITIFSMYLAVVYGVLYLLFSTFTFVYRQQYGFSQGVIGLSYLPTGIGMFIGVMVFGAVTDMLVKKQQSKKADIKPEDRLPVWLTLPTGLLVPASLFWYGWTVENNTHWAVPMVATGFFAFGLIGVMMCIQVYLVDSYIKYAASVIAAITVLRSLVGALLPLAGLTMYRKLGYGWGNGVLAFISLAMVPVPVAFRFFGEGIRKKFPAKV